jgi:hypothetical protein
LFNLQVLFLLKYFLFYYWIIFTDSGYITSWFFTFFLVFIIQTIYFISWIEDIISLILQRLKSPIRLKKIFSWLNHNHVLIIILFHLPLFISLKCFHKLQNNQYFALSCWVIFILARCCILFFFIFHSDLHFTKSY